MARGFLFRLAASVPKVPNLAATNILYVATNGNDLSAGTTPTTPLRTIQAAADRASPGTIIMVRGGVYQESIWVGADGTAASYIVFRSYPGEKAIVDGSANAGEICVGLGGNYIEFRDFEVRGSKGPGIYAYENHHTIISNNIVHDNISSGILIGPDTTGVSHDHLIQGNTVYRNCLVNQARNLSGGWPQGIGAARTEVVKIIGNTVYNNYGEGIGSYLSKQVTISNNVIYDNFSVDLYLDNVMNSTLERNFVYSTGNTNYFKSGQPALSIAIAVEAYEEQIPNSGNKIINNITVGGGAGFYYGNYDLGGGLQNNLIAHNTFANSIGAGVHIDADAGHSGNQVFNNIVFRSSAGTLAAGTATGFSFGENCWSGGSSGSFSGSGDVNSDPLFSSPGALSPSGYILNSGSPCAQSGSLIAAVPADFYGKIRTNNVSAGAHEA